VTIAVKKDIRKYSLKELKEVFESWHEKTFRAKQVYEWLWQKEALSFEEMTNISKELRFKLNEFFCINAISEDLVQKSEDGTIKIRFKLFDGELIEGVIIPAMNRITACVSSQVGCSLTCKFCATGFMDRKRNLDPAEIFDQVALMNNYFNCSNLNLISFDLSNMFSLA
jgi:23S rRNA (adenine2503-C2)-methyltransferase